MVSSAAEADARVSTWLNCTQLAYSYLQSSAVVHAPPSRLCTSSCNSTVNSTSSTTRLSSSPDPEPAKDEGAESVVAAIVAPPPPPPPRTPGGSSITRCDDFTRILQVPPLAGRTRTGRRSASAGLPAALSSFRLPNHLVDLACLLSGVHGIRVCICSPTMPTWREWFVPPTPPPPPVSMTTVILRPIMKTVETGSRDGGACDDLALDRLDIVSTTHVERSSRSHYPEEDDGGGGDHGGRQHLLRAMAYGTKADIIAQATSAGLLHEAGAVTPTKAILTASILRLLFDAGAA